MPLSQATAPPVGLDTVTAAVVMQQLLATRRCHQEVTTGWLLVVQTAMEEAKPWLVQEAMGLLGTTAMEEPKLPSLVQEAMDLLGTTATEVPKLPSLVQEAMGPSVVTAMGVDTQLWLVQEESVTAHMLPLVLISQLVTPVSLAPRMVVTIKSPSISTSTSRHLPPSSR